MNSYWFQYDTTTDVIYPYKQDNSPSSSAQTGVLGPYPVDTASPTIVMAYTYPERFLAQGNPIELVEQPYFTVSTQQSTTTSGEWTIIATLNNPPATPPADATLNILGQSVSAALTNNQATFTVQLHSSVETAQVTVTVGATGCAMSRPTNIGGNTSPSVGLQIFTPSGGVPTVAPVGANSKGFLEAFYALSPATIQSLLADIGTAVSLLTDAVFNVILPAVNPTLTAAQQAAVNEVKASVLPNLYTTLANADPNGTKQLQFANYETDLAKTYQAFTSYMNDLQAIPGLA